ncbi:hypothetical protein QBC39DRAFT_102678 [Podospora conica]|nr:hypothetical protein QBC39DRAFT_102678 [Schizothecium conicum]
MARRRISCLRQDKAAVGARVWVARAQWQLAQSSPTWGPPLCLIDAQDPFLSLSSRQSLDPPIDGLPKFGVKQSATSPSSARERDTPGTQGRSFFSFPQHTHIARIAHCRRTICWKPRKPSATTTPFLQLLQVTGSGLLSIGQLFFAALLSTPGRRSLLRWASLRTWTPSTSTSQNSTGPVGNHQHQVQTTTRLRHTSIALAHRPGLATRSSPPLLGCRVLSPCCTTFCRCSCCPGASVSAVARRTPHACRPLARCPASSASRHEIPVGPCCDLGLYATPSPPLTSPHLISPSPTHANSTCSPCPVSVRRASPHACARPTPIGSLLIRRSSSRIG